MLYFLRTYPVSLTIIAIVIYLSFFKPPQMAIEQIPGIDKVIHFCMYGGLSGILWIEFLNNHPYKRKSWHVWIGAVICPIAMSGIIELIQQYCTTYRGGEWSDFMANSLGVITATMIAYFLICPWMTKRYIKKHNRKE